jgi:multicomponent Na+:H+ antiporter subunit D
MSALLPLAVAIPVLSAALLTAGGTHVNRTTANLFAAAAAVAVTVICLVILLHPGTAPIVTWFGGWEPRNGVPIGIDFAVDDLSAGLAAFIAVLTVLALVMLAHYRETDPPHLQALILVFCAGMIGFVFSGDLFDMFVFFELMSVSAFALTGFRSRHEESLAGALNFAITNTVGSIVLLLGIGLVYGRTGALNLAAIGEQLGSAPIDGLVVVAFALIVAGFLIKAAAVPFHFWLADAYAVAPTPICLLLAGAMSELGLYGIGRVWFASFADAFGTHGADVALVLIVCGAATALIGAVMCMAQDHLKRMLAFATIAYVGIFLVGLGTLTEDGIAGAALFVVSDGANKAALFGAVGILQHRKAAVSERRLRGAAADLPLLAVVFVLGALSFAAVPLSGAFAGKAMIEDALTAGGDGWAIAAIVAASVLVTATVLRAAARIFLGWGPAEEDAAGDRGKPSPDKSGDEDEEGEADEEDVDRDRTPATLLVPTVLLVTAPLVLGVVPGVADRFLDAAAAFVAGPSYHGAVLGSAGAAPGAPAFVAHASAFWIAALTAAAAVAVAALALASERRGAGILPGAGRLAERAVAPLRAIHTGHAGDYVAWSVLGMAAVGGALALAAGFPA